MYLEYHQIDITLRVRVQRTGGRRLWMCSKWSFTARAPRKNVQFWCSLSHNHTNDNQENWLSSVSSKNTPPLGLLQCLLQKSTPAYIAGNSQVMYDEFVIEYDCIEIVVRMIVVKFEVAFSTGLYTYANLFRVCSYLNLGLRICTSGHVTICWKFPTGHRNSI